MMAMVQLMVFHDGSKLVMFGTLVLYPDQRCRHRSLLPPSELYNKQDGTFEQATGVFAYGDIPDGAGNTQRGYGAVLDVDVFITVASKGGAGAGEDPVGFNVGTQVLNLKTLGTMRIRRPPGQLLPGGDGFTTGTRPDGTEVGAGGGAFVRVTKT